MGKRCFISLALILFLILMGQSKAQLLLEENFDYTASTYLTDNGWTAYSGIGNAPIVVESASLLYEGYPSSGIGGSVIVDADGEDAYKLLSSTQTSGIIYASLLVNITNATIGLG